MAAAYPNRTSPVLRGAFILKHIQGVPPANPPANVPTLDEKDIGTTKALTVREMIAKHRASPTCAACHAVMDPLGLALENFDATGMWRDRDRYAGAAIDSSGVLPDGTPVNGPDDLRQALTRRPEQFVQTFAEGLLTYATGRKLEAYDMPTVRRIVTRRGGQRLPVLGAGPGGRAQRPVPDAARAAAGGDADGTEVGAGFSRPMGRLKPALRRRDDDVSVAEARLTAHGVEGRGRHDRAAAPRRDESRPRRRGRRPRPARRRSGSRSSAFRTARSWTAGRPRRPAPTSSCRRFCSRSSR